MNVQRNVSISGVTMCAKLLAIALFPVLLLAQSPALTGCSTHSRLAWMGQNPESACSGTR